MNHEGVCIFPDFSTQIHLLIRCCSFMICLSEVRPMVSDGCFEASGLMF